MRTALSAIFNLMCLFFLVSSNVVNSQAINTGPKAGFPSWTYSSGITDVIDNTVPTAHSAPYVYQFASSSDYIISQPFLLNNSTASNQFVTFTISARARIGTATTVAIANGAAISSTRVSDPTTLSYTIGSSGAILNATWQNTNAYTGGTPFIVASPGANYVYVKFYPTLLIGGSLIMDDFNINLSCTGCMTTPLPVTLVNFTIKSVNCQATISWIGTIENNFSYYEVQQSADGNNFTTVEKITGKGSGTNYTSRFTLSANNEYVRLKMTDNNGTITYSDILPVNSNCANDLAAVLYPNPTTSMLTISGLGTANKSIRISSVNGTIVYSIQTSNAQVNINVKNWAPGMYFVKISTGGENVKVIKVMKQ